MEYHIALVIERTIIMKKKLLSLLLAIAIIFSLSTIAFAYEDEEFEPIFYCSAEEIAANNNRLPDRFIESLKYAPYNSAIHFAPDGSASLEVPENSSLTFLDDDVTELSIPSSQDDNMDLEIPQAISDDRIEITDVNYYPYRAVVQIVAIYADGTTLLSSGVLMGPKGVLTTAHTVYSSKRGKAQYVEIFSGGFNSDYDKLTSSDLHISTSWLFDETDDSDYAVITLASDQNLGYFGMTWYRDNKDLMEHEVYRLSFLDDDKLWQTATAEISYANSTLFSYKLKRQPGESGAPVLSATTSRVLGMHLGGGTESSIAQRVTKSIFDFIVTYARDGKV